MGTLPDGKRYVPGLAAPVGVDYLVGDAWLVEQAYQRHLVQVMYVDTFISELIDRLERNDTYDEALIVVTADHGVAVRPKTYRRIIAGQRRRRGGGPVFVNLPVARARRRDDRAESVDVLPTMAAVLGLEDSLGRSTAWTCSATTRQGRRAR